MMTASIGYTETIIAKDFTTKTVGAAQDDGSWNIWAEGYIAKSFNISTSGDYLIEIEARGDLAGSEAPNMKVEIDGKTQNIAVTSNVYNKYQLRFSLSSGLKDLKISFTNDYYVNSSQDRNLIIKSGSVTSTQTPPTPDVPELIKFNGTTKFSGEIDPKTGIGKIIFSGE
jgi:hypothetical protein